MKSRWLYLVALFLYCATFALAQQAITGTVTDKSNAVIANAKVTVTFRDTNSPTSTVTTNSGDFTASNLKVGVYTVVIEAKGFKTYKRENIQLDADQKYRMDAKMEVGTESTTVTVVADASTLRTDSSALTYNITLKDLQDLPFFNIGTAQPNALGSALRDPYAVAAMLPGVRYNRDANIMLINGLPADQVQYRIDGQVTGLTRGGFTTLDFATQPSPDAIEEIAVTTSNYSAEFGSVGGALFNVTMKSGTNQYHGSAYDYAVNEMLNAFTAVGPAGGGAKTRNKNRRQNWGFTFGGPVKIPHVYDGTNKTFFFWSLDWLTLSQSTSSSVGFAQTMPTPAYAKGDFSSLFGIAQNLNVTVGSGNPCAAGQVSTTASPCIRDYRDVFGNTIARGQLFNPASYTTVTCDKTVAPNSDCTAGSAQQYRYPLLGNNLLNAQLQSPQTGVTYTGMDPVAVKLLSYLPAPTDTTTPFNNYFVPFVTKQTNRIPSLKLDHNINASSRVSLTMQETSQNQPQFQWDGLPNPITGSIASKASSPQIRANFDQTLTPTLQLHLGAGWTQFDLDRQPQFTFDPADPANGLGFAGTLGHRYFPRFDSNAVTTAPAFGGLSAVGLNTGSALDLERHPSGSASLTWIRGSHTIKGGFDWRMAMLPHIDPSFTDGHFGAFQVTNATTFVPGQGVTGQPLFSTSGVNATNNFTGLSFASLMMGGVNTFGLRREIAYRESNYQYGSYLQDSWRATRKLTVDLGVRWDMGTYTREDHGRNGALSLTVPNPAWGNRLGAVIYESQCHCTFAQNYPYGLGPRVGFAYTMNPKTVLRAGFGWSYGTVGQFGAYPSNANLAQSSTGYLAAFLMRDGVPAGSIPPPWPSFDPTGGQTQAGVLPAATGGSLQLLDQNAGRPSRTLQWNVGIQRELTRNLVLEASYVGNRGVWQSNAALENLNPNSLGLMQQYGFNPYDPANYTTLTTTINLLSPAVRSAHNLWAPLGPNWPTGATVLGTLRNYPQWGQTAINPQRAPLGKSWYDSLQLSLNKRYSHGLMVNANYTLSKNLSSATPMDINNPNYNNKDLALFNLPQQIRVTFQYQTPRPPKWMPVIGQRWVAYAFEGWGVSMALRYFGGNYQTRPNSDSTQAITSIFGGSTTMAQLKKDANGHYMSPYSVDWYDNSGNHHTDPLDVNCHCFDPMRTQVLNPNAWTAVPSLTWPSQTQTIPGFRGPRTPQESGNISRTFRMGKEGRVNLNIRAEFQNIFNRMLLPTNYTVGDFAGPAVGRNAVGVITSGFGTLSSFGLYTPGASRSGTLVGRITF